MRYSGVIALPNNIDRIVGNLFLGGNPTQDDVEDYKFIVAMNHTPEYQIPDQTMVLTCPIKDDDHVPDRDVLHRVVSVVEQWSQVGPTLVHCSAGLNRSAMIVGMVLINQGMTANDAIELIRQKRGSDALHNAMFVDWLKFYYAQKKKRAQ